MSYWINIALKIVITLNSASLLSFNSLITHLMDGLIRCVPCALKSVVNKELTTLSILNKVSLTRIFNVISTNHRSFNDLMYLPSVFNFSLITCWIK